MIIMIEKKISNEKKKKRHHAITRHEQIYPVYHTHTRTHIIRFYFFAFFSKIRTQRQDASHIYISH